MNLKEILKLKSWKNFFKIKVVPNASQTEVIWFMDDGITLKIKVKWIPENWKVNKELIHFLWKNLELSDDKIIIVSGLTNRNKLLRIDF